MQTGHNPVDPSYVNVTRHKKWVIPWMEDDPDLSAPQLWVNRTLEHMEDAKKYGCSGLLGIHWRTKSTGPQISAMSQKSWTPELTSQQFWYNWANASFGSEVAGAAAAVFESIDSFLMPTVVSWSGGPGSISATCDPKRATKFAFVDTLQSLERTVNGDVHAARLHYWVKLFEYMRGIADFSCAYLDFNTALAKAQAGATPAAKQQLAETLALPARIAMIANATVLITALQQTLSDVGGLGTYMNVESRSFIHAIQEQTAPLSALLQKPLPPAALPPTTYSGPARMVVPTLRSTLDRGEVFHLRVMVLSAQPCSQVVIKTQALGGDGTYGDTLPFTNVGRSVFEVNIPGLTSDFEYYVEANCGSTNVLFPPGAPTNSQSIVVM
eukprot:m.559765 g.559765  ORF g.559765 m.559765 type:complete len:383 (+) comp22208_c0_seq8:339-1487(+)